MLGLIRDQEVPSSNLGAPTTSLIGNHRRSSTRPPDARPPAARVRGQNSAQPPGTGSQIAQCGNQPSKVGDLEEAFLSSRQEQRKDGYLHGVSETNQRRLLSRGGSCRYGRGTPRSDCPQALDSRVRNISESGIFKDLQHLAGQPAIPSPHLLLADAVVVSRLAELPKTEQGTATDSVEKPYRNMYMVFCRTGAFGLGKHNFHAYFQSLIEITGAWDWPEICSTTVGQLIYSRVVSPGLNRSAAIL